MPLHSLPVLLQLTLVERNPVGYKRHRPWRQRTPQTPDWIDGDRRALTSVARMYVGWRMIVVIHGYSNSVELTDPRHLLLLPFAARASVSHKGDNLLLT